MNHLYYQFILIIYNSNITMSFLLIIKIIYHINDLNFDLNIKNFFRKKNIKSIINFMKMDKKNKTSKINLILIKEIGKPIINNNFRIKKIETFLKKELI